MSKELSRAINERVILRLAGEQVRRRGEDYYLHGHVESVAGDESAVVVTVRDKHRHTVRLSAEEGILDYSCGCPAGVKGSFCMHCVAAGLAWLSSATRTRRNSGRKAREISLADAEKALLTEDKETLVQHLLDWARTDAQLRQRLIMHAAQGAGGQASLAAAQRAFQRAAGIRGFIHYRQMPPYCRRVDKAIDSIEELLVNGQPAGVIRLCEFALSLLEKTVDLADDSGGGMRELFDRLQDIHYRACREAPPDAAELAKRLFVWELHSDRDVFFDAVSRYAEILGPEGMAEYQELAQAEWAKVPPLTATDRREWGQYFRISHVMESLARLSGDVETLVSVLSRDLSNAYRYVRVAEAYRDAGDFEKALEWAERGLRAFPQRTDYRLRKVLADEYHRRNRHGEAMSLIWAAFEERPELESYEGLREHANAAGHWPEWRGRALDLVRRQTESEKTAAQHPETNWTRPVRDHSLIVEIFLHEGDMESAWREAQGGGCRSPLWLRLAELRESNHPADAAAVYLKQADLAVKTATNSKYADGVELLVKAGAVMRRTGRTGEFTAHVQAMRMKYKMKRNFLKLLDEAEEALRVA